MANFEPVSAVSAAFQPMEWLTLTYECGEVNGPTYVSKVPLTPGSPFPIAFRAAADEAVEWMAKSLADDLSRTSA